MDVLSSEGMAVNWRRSHFICKELHRPQVFVLVLDGSVSGDTTKATTKCRSIDSYQSIGGSLGPVCLYKYNNAAQQFRHKTS